MKEVTPELRKQRKLRKRARRQLDDASSDLYTWLKLSKGAVSKQEVELIYLEVMGVTSRLVNAVGEWRDEVCGEDDDRDAYQRLDEQS